MAIFEGLRNRSIHWVVLLEPAFGRTGLFVVFFSDFDMRVEGSYREGYSRSIVVLSAIKMSPRKSRASPAASVGVSHNSSSSKSSFARTPPA